MASRILTQLGTSSDTVERIQKFQGVRLPCGVVRSKDLRIQDRPKCVYKSVGKFPCGQRTSTGN